MKKKDAGERTKGAMRSASNRSWTARWRMRIRVVSQANDEQRAALSGDPAIRNAVSSGDEHFYFYPAVSAFCSLLCSRFLLFPEARAAKKAGDACIPMLSSTGARTRLLVPSFPYPHPLLSTYFFEYSFWM